MHHPYRDLPSCQIWSKAVSETFETSSTWSKVFPLVHATDKVMSAGSCFAANLVPYLERAGFTYLRTEYLHPILTKIPPENISYGRFSAGYGNVYTTRQLLQLLLRCLGEFTPQESCWVSNARYIDAFRPALAYAARSVREFDLLTASHLRAVRRAFTECDVFIFTLGLTEAWVSALDGAVFPACPGTISGEYDPARHVFINLTVDNMTNDLRKFVNVLRESLNPSVRIILTVSPVPLAATAESQHVLCSNTYSKSALRVVAENISREFDEVYYFPAYEIVTGPQAPKHFFHEDRRNVTNSAVEAVMAAFFTACDVSREERQSSSENTTHGNTHHLSQTLCNIECEEVAQLTSIWPPNSSHS